MHDDKKDSRLEAEEEALTLWRTLYGVGGEGIVVCTSLPGPHIRRFPANSLEEAAHWAISQAHDGEDVYFNLALQAPHVPVSGRGKARDAWAIAGVVAEVDVAGAAHNETRLPPSFEDARAFLGEFPLPPSLLVHSGHGLHVYWCLSQLYYIRNEEDRARAKRLCSAFVKEVQSRGGERGWKLDPVGDLARMFRVPGTINWKDHRERGGEPVPVRLLKGDPDRRYTVEDLERFLDHDGSETRRKGPRAPGSRRFGEKGTTKQSRGAAVEPIVKGCDWFRNGKEQAARLSEPDWFGWLNILSRCEGGEELAHQWSSQHEAYSWEETDEKLRRGRGMEHPLSCSYIRYQLDGEESCASCQHWSRVRSPLDLGMPSDKGKSQATQLIDLAQEVELFHSPDGKAFATALVDGHRETMAVGSDGFQAYLVHRFYQETGMAPGRQALEGALNTLAAKARFEGEERPVFIRVGALDGRVYLDLGSKDWEAVEIAEGAWRVVRNPGVRFHRPHGVRPLPYPEAGGSLQELWPFVNVRGERDQVLLVSWLVAALRPQGPYPMLILSGEQGSAKSTACRVIRALIDPFTAPLRTPPRDERDLMITASNGWVVAMDNVSRIPDWLSDGLCRLSTGGGFATRQLYTDAEEVILDVTRPVLWNGIGEVATRSDLLDRAVVLTLPSIGEGERREEAEFWRRFHEARPRILGALLDALAVALNTVDGVDLERLPRMADFARFATAAEPALGFPPGSFMRAYGGAMADNNSLALEASPIGAFVMDLSEKGWHGTAAELLLELDSRAEESTRRQRGWPHSSSFLSSMLRRLAPNLRAEGVEVTFKREPGGKRTRLIDIERVEGSSQQRGPSSPGDGEEGTAASQGDVSASQREEGSSHRDGSSLGRGTGGTQGTLGPEGKADKGRSLEDLIRKLSSNNRHAKRR